MSALNQACCVVAERVHSGADVLLVVMRKFREVAGVVPHMLKADIDSAYRGIPIQPEHRCGCRVV